MKLIFSIIVSSMACGFFAGLFIFGHWLWIFAAALSAIIGLGLISAVGTEPINEDDLA